MSGFPGQHDWQVYDPDGRRKYLSSDERCRFLKATERLPEAERALCSVLVYAGCRISEALALTRDHVDADRLALTFRTLKRRRTVFRIVPVPEEVVETLHRLPMDGGARFWPMHRATAWRLVKLVMNRAGIRGPMACPKGLRHAFGVRAAGSHVPPNLIQRWMGHASGSTTATYLDVVGLEERQFAQRMWRAD